MYSIQGQPVRTCEGISRREWLRVGGLGSLGLSGGGLHMSDVMAGRAAAGGASTRLQSNAASSFGRAKSCIVLFMFGAPAHQDTWDLKPNAPKEVRGEFDPIDSIVPGITVSEHVPRLSRMTDKFAQIRSLTHPDNTHTVAMHYMLSGVRHKRPKTNPQNAGDDFPCFGAVTNYAGMHDERFRCRRTNAAGGPVNTVLPPGVSLNAPANQVSANNHIFPGFFAGFLGNKYDPLFIAQHANEKSFTPLPPVKNRERLFGRKRLLAEVEQQSQHLSQSATTSSLNAYYQQAFQLLTSVGTRRAFDIERETAKLRQRYGMTPFGQGCVLARRLVEASVSLVTVNWERDDAYWDTHADNFNKHKNKLLPNMDQGYSALLEDLEQRGLLDETLVVWLAEFGRTPKINGNAGRDHWAACNTVLLAGAGIRGGQVHGASDRIAAYPTLNPVRPEDLSATIYHLLGIDPATTIKTAEGQPLPLSHGEPVWALL